MPTIDVRKIAAGLSPTWVGYLRDWDRTLRAANHPDTTRHNYLLAAAQLGRYLSAESPDPDADDAADDPCQVTRGHLGAFQAWMVDTRSASTALNKHSASSSSSSGWSSTRRHSTGRRCNGSDSPSRRRS